MLTQDEIYNYLLLFLTKNYGYTGNLQKLQTANWFDSGVTILGQDVTDIVDAFCDSLNKIPGVKVDDGGFVFPLISQISEAVGVIFESQPSGEVEEDLGDESPDKFSEDDSGTDS